MANRCKYYKEEEYISLDGGISWTAMGVYRKGDLIESGSTDCGYVPLTQITYYSPSKLNVALSSFTPTATAETFSNGVGQIEFAESVTAIGQGAFSGKTAMTSIDIPNSVTSIDYGAFNNCTSLTSVTIPSGVTSIGDSAFFKCSGLTSIDIPSGVTRINSLVFGNCTSLTSVTIPSGVTYIGAGAFQLCSGLTSVTCLATTPPAFGRIPPFGNTNNCPIYVPCESVEAYKTAWSAYESRIQCVNPPTPEYRWTNSGWTCSGASGYDKYNLQVKEVSYDSGSTWSAVTPTETQLGTLIEANSEDCGYVPPVFGGKFKATYSDGRTYSAECTTQMDILSKSDVSPNGYQYNSMTSAVIGSCVNRIAYKAFDNCISLTSVTMPNSFKSIGGGAFSGCTNLKYITIPSGVTRLNDETFQNCTSLPSITIPSGVTSIGYRDFYWCTSLQSINFPDSVTSIGTYAFQNCTSLTSVTIPNSVTSIGYYAFSDCTSLTSITIPDSVTTIEERVFYNCRSLTSCTIGSGVTSIGGYAFADCHRLTSVTIPDSVTSIGQVAFGYCSGLTSCTIGNGVTSIGDSAFLLCSGLTSVAVEATTPPTLGGTSVFYRTNNCPIYVPSASVDAYKTAENWSTYADRIQAIP